MPLPSDLRSELFWLAWLRRKLENDSLASGAVSRPATHSADLLELQGGLGGGGSPCASMREQLPSHAVEGHASSGNPKP